MPAKGKTKLTATQKTAVIAGKAAGLTDAAAAARAGVSRAVVHKVLKDPGTRDIFREIVASLDAELQGLAGIVVETLVKDLVSAQNEASRARLRDEALNTFARLRQLGGIGIGLGVDGASGAAGGTGMTLGDILVRVSHTHPSSNPAPTHANGSATT